MLPRKALRLGRCYTRGLTTTLPAGQTYEQSRFTLVQSMAGRLRDDVNVSLSYTRKRSNPADEGVDDNESSIGAAPDSDMTITFLGTCAGSPSSVRNSSSLVLTMPHTAWMFDCGEGTQHRMFKCLSPKVKPSAIDRIFITHLHGDHVLGLPGMLLFLNNANPSRTMPLHIHGPPGLRSYIHSVLRTIGSYIQIPYYVHEYSPVDNGKITRIYSDGKTEIHAGKIKHTIDCWGFIVTEMDKKGELNVKALEELAVPKGPYYGQLKAGETILLPDGRILDGNDFVSSTIPGRKIVILGDTSNADNLIAKAKNADVVIHEATLTDQEENVAIRRGHSTPSMAASFARKSDAKLLILNHVSPKVNEEGFAVCNGIPPVDIRQQAIGAFGSENVIVAVDYLRIDIGRKSAVERQRIFKQQAQLHAGQ